MLLINYPILQKHGYGLSFEEVFLRFDYFFLILVESLNVWLSED